ncbi:MAG: type VI secretion system tip protein VgrG, partial [Gammaproteobacteria bacterium]|nr:type VI secretion system tip protein VgrG [Gammaproteobacteria bacterium]
TRTPNKVVISDYNYRKPTTPLKATASIESNGVGLLSEYGSHFKTPDEGEVLAKIRAEEISARKNIYTGASDCAYFRVGHVFTLAGHYREASNQEYLITKVRHEGALEDLSTLKPGTTHMESTSYRNSFSALPLSMAYRPQRATPIPKLYGIMNAHIDGAGEGDYAEIDEFGRYKVVMPFDLTSTGGGKASRYIRMAQPSSGSNQGFHFPLRKGTEIIWTCIDGDLDRPVIVGAVPNARTPSPVNAENHRRNIIRTGGGNEINIDDNSGSQRIKLTTPHGGGTTIQMGAPNGPEDGLLLATAGGSTAISGIGKTVMSPFKSVYSFFTTKNAKGITSIAKKESDKSVLDYFGLAAGMLTTLGALGSVTLKTVQSVQKEIINEQEGCVNEGEEEVYNKKKELDDLYEQDAQRLEAVLNAFPNATTSGSPHTTEEQAFIDQLLLFSRSKEEKLTARKTVEDKRKDLEKALKANEDYKYTDLILGIELANENRLGFGVNVYPSTTTDGRDIQELEGKDTQIFAHAADANTVFQNLFQRNDSGAPLEPAAFVSDSVSCTVSPQELRDLFATWFDQHRSFENPQRDLDTVMKRTHLQTVEFLEAKTDFESGSTANDEEIADSVFKGAMASEGVFSLISKLIGMFQHKEVKLKVQRFWNRPARALNRALDNRLRSMWPSDLPQEGLTTFVDPAQDYYHILGAETATAVYGKKNLICYADTAILGGIRTGGPENNSPIPNQGVAIVYAENNAIVYSECNAELSANRRTFVSGQYVDLKGEDSVEITTGENGEIWISQGMMGATTRAKITIRDNKIEIEGMDVNIKATGNLCLEATQNLEIKAGVNIDIDANAQTNIRGGIVNLN